MNYGERIEQFQKNLADAAVDAAFLPISADLQYLTGLPRPMPHFGAETTAMEKGSVWGRG